MKIIKVTLSCIKLLFTPPKNPAEFSAFIVVWFVVIGICAAFYMYFHQTTELF